MLQQIQQCLAEWNRSQPNEARADLDRFVCLVDTKGSIDACIALIFGATGDTPRLVAKATPYDRALRRGGRGVVEQEFETLTQLDRMGMNRGGEGTPLPLGKWQTEGILVTLQSALSGRLMKNTPARELFASSRIDATMDKVFHWWRRLQEGHGTTAITLDEEAYRTLVLEPLERFQRHFILEPVERKYLDRRLREQRGLAGVELPLMVRHGDFCTANMAERPDGLGVFDWEFALRPELPLFDLFYFFGSLRYPYRGLRGESSHFASFAEVFWGDNYVNAAARRCLGRACETFGVPGHAVADLFLIALVQVANLKLDGLVEFFGVDETQQRSEERVAELWRTYAAGETDVPFVSIDAGACENTRFVARNGLPTFD